MDKKDRQIVFNKFGGKCAYCGCELQKGWHIDHMQPIERKKKWIKGTFVDIYTKEKWVEGKWVNDGMKYPERDCLGNMIPACASCNINKHGMSVEDFRKQIIGFMKHLNEVSTQYKIAKRFGLIKETNYGIEFFFEATEYFKTKL